MTACYSVSTRGLKARRVRPCSHCQRWVEYGKQTEARRVRPCSPCQRWGDYGKQTEARRARLCSPCQRWGGGGGDYGKRMLDNSPQLDPWLLWTLSHSVESVPPSLGTKINMRKDQNCAWLFSLTLYPLSCPRYG